MILRFLLALLILLPTQSFADEVLSLPEILNPSTEKNNGQQVTSLTMANEYYNSCINEKTLVFEPEEMELLCACKSANMTEHLSVSDFKNLKDKSIDGRNARGKAIAFGYTPCMSFIIESKATRDCRESKVLNDIVRGKKDICDCAIGNLQKIMTENGSYFIMEAIKYEPMSLNPMEHYFRQPAYFNQLTRLIRNCRNDYQFKQDHR